MSQARLNLGSKTQKSFCLCNLKFWVKFSALQRGATTYIHTHTYTYMYIYIYISTHSIVFIWVLRDECCKSIDSKKILADRGQNRTNNQKIYFLYWACLHLKIKVRIQTDQRPSMQPKIKTVLLNEYHKTGHRHVNQIQVFLIPSIPPSFPGAALNG